ncbi:PLD nuclease N-terminal domain-containing protein [Actinoplanes hulinensis]|uniref:PLD nuclease N-terminal domain-containing protein n=1 Tax=Actinoplanes hulinensis TaxID=1144547 RepID=A0ABS7BB12_9ACTN|nr:PLD nuclease N-terminal domain-containing protein [Actinoplanes hulinensis]MBW6438242.1 PLD nuclease N-terminal domain-containing protein [Actinoplanes hulinensis]
MTRLLTILLFAVVALSVLALIDCLRTDRSRVRSFPRAAWAAIILLIPVSGAVVWFLGGRAAAAPAGAAARRPVGPDDDPVFLRQLTEQLRRR